MALSWRLYETHAHRQPCNQQLGKEDQRRQMAFLLHFMTQVGHLSSRSISSLAFLRRRLSPGNSGSAVQRIAVPRSQAWGMLISFKAMVSLSRSRLAFGRALQLCGGAVALLSLRPCEHKPWRHGPVCPRSPVQCAARHIWHPCRTPRWPSKQLCICIRNNLRSI